MSRARVTNHWGEWFNSSDWEWRYLVESEKDPTDPLAWDTSWPERAPHRVVGEVNPCREVQMQQPRPASTGDLSQAVAWLRWLPVQPHHYEFKSMILAALDDTSGFANHDVQEDSGGWTEAGLEAMQQAVTGDTNDTSGPDPTLQLDHTVARDAQRHTEEQR